MSALGIEAGSDASLTRKERRKQKSERRKVETATQKIKRLERHIAELTAIVEDCDEKINQYQSWIDTKDTSKNLHMLEYSIVLQRIRKSRVEKAAQKARSYIASL
jgi:t-SNARE complex subunit (syntaxin)